MAPFRKKYRQYVLGVAIACAVATLGVYWLYAAEERAVASAVSPVAVIDLSPSRQPGDSLQAVAGNSSMVVSPTAGTSEADHSHQIRHQHDRLRWHDRIAGYSEEGGNFQQFFAQLLAQCGSEQDLCEALLNDRLAGYPDTALADRLRAVLQKMPAYEAAMKATVLSSEQSPEARYQTIDTMRVNFFGEASAEMLYGQERAWAEYQFGYERLIEQAAPSMAPAQRLAELDNLKRNAWGPYYEPLSEQENASARYRQEKQLLLIGVSDSAQQEAITAALRQKYFDADLAHQIAEQETRSAEQKVQRATYAEARQVLQNEMQALQGRMPDSEWQSLYQTRLKQLRKKLW